MKHHNHKFVPFYFGMLTLLLVLSCSSIPPNQFNLKFTDSLEQVEEMASDIVVGQTSSEEVIEAFGTPFSTVKDENGNVQFSYRWRTTPVRTRIGMGEVELSYDPHQSNLKPQDSYYKMSSDQVMLNIQILPEGIVDGFHVMRTKPHCPSCQVPFHE